MTPAKLARYYHTARYLKFKQVFFRVYYVCKFSRVGEHIEVIRRGASRHLQRRRKISDSPFTPGFLSWASPRVLPFCLTDSGEFSFQGETGQIIDSGIWNSHTHSKLWLYNLHYFDELNRIGAETRQALLNQYIDSWIDNNPPYKGNGWEPYPLSLRIVNWIKWFCIKGAELKWLSSLSIQVDALTKQIEYHILGNHLFVNAKALVFAGTYSTDKRAHAWLKKGLHILDQEVNEQFLADGGHFELSPMYHASLLWDMCDLVHLAEQSNHAALLSRKARWIAVIKRGLDWLSCMVHPDGEIAFFNDAALGIAPTFADLLLYARQLGIHVSHANESVRLLNDSGYCVVNLQNNNKAILDLAKIGPDYQPGHAHADTLSFELSLYGQRFLVNSGTSQYGDGMQRWYERSTKAHNTVCIDGKNSSEVWGGFRVAQRAYPQDVSVRSQAKKVIIGCSHDGYARLPGRNTHYREWVFAKNSLILSDVIAGRYSSAEARFYLHPDVDMISQEDSHIACCLSAGQEILFKFDGASEIHIESSHWHPYFGVSVKNTCLVVTFNKNELETQISW